MKKIHLLKVLFVALAMITGSNMVKAQCHAKYKVKISNDSASFTDSSSTSVGKIAYYIWSFGDGYKSSTQNPVHVYANSGTYWACLTIITSAGCRDSICDSVHITVKAPLCDASFGFYNSTTNADSIHFYNKNTAKTYKTYAWSFGDGKYSTDQYPWHYYAKAGKYYVCVKVTDSNSSGTCTDTKCDSIQVGSTTVAPTCDASMAFYTSSTNVDSVHLYPKNTALKAKTYYWSFGDGTYSSVSAPWHYYSKPGKYYVCLTTTDSNSAGTCKDTKCDSLQVGSTTSAPKCDATFAFYNSTTNADSVHFYNKNTASNYKTYAWSFGDGTYSTDKYPWHYYSKPGKYYICCKVTDSTSAGTCTDTKCDSVQVGSTASAPKCDATFAFYNSTTNADSVHFYNKNTASNYKTYAWSFGDGTYSTDKYPWHYYSKPGKYYICCKVTDSTSAGTCTDTKCDSVQVGSTAPAPKCDATFAFYNSTTNVDSVHFYNKNTASNYKTYAWSFGDGTYSTDKYPWHYYSKPGKYYICCKVTDSTSAGTCTDTKCDSVQIGSTATKPKCDASFAFYNSSTNKDSVHFYSTNTSYKYKSYAWSFGDGHYASTRDPWHLFAKPGKYYVCMKVTDSTAGGTCYDIKCDSITIYSKTVAAPKCDASFAFYSIASNKDSIHFYNKNTSYKYKTYAWSFGDGTYSTDQYPWHYYSKAGKYYVCVRVTDSTSGGTCSETKCDSIVVGTTVAAPKCDASFAFYTSSTNTDSIHFYSKNTSYKYKSYAWSFGDGNYANTRDPWHHYAKPGKYYVCMKVIDTTAGGTCSDIKCDSITIAAKSTSTPTCDATYGHYTSTTNNDSLHFYSTNTSHKYKSYAWSFGDGSYSTDQNPWHYYSKAGKYYVCMKVTDSNSAGTCTDTKCDSVTVAGNSGSNKFYLYGLVNLGTKGTALASGDHGHVWAIKYDSASGTLTAVDSTTLDSTHHYLFMLPAGNYLVKVALDSGSTNYKYYLPTYYESKLHWDSALVVHLTSSQTAVNIHMISGKNTGGPGFIGGYVSQGANKTEAKGDPIAGVEVILYNESMEPIDYTYSKADGTYGFDNLAYGTYYVHPEVVGKETFHLQVSIGASKEARKDVDITVNSLYVVVEMGVDNIIATENIISNVYPNPALNVLNITMNTEKMVTGKICIVDIQGKTILEQNINNKNNIQLDVAQLPQGIYNIMLQTKTGEVFSRRFVKQ